ncbi:MAG: metalloregulator ArsR/SmtB family transcription factor [Bacillaceae bacterium]|nr:metalloregulator ArsR/SmtB family transcription factor [Bacillaceae bacterium]
MSKNNQCDVFNYDSLKVDNIKQCLTEVDGVAEIFKALADETRVKIIYALSKSELCVCDVAAIIDGSTAIASHHLRTLKKHRLAKSRKQGKMVFYSIDDEHITELLLQAIAHKKEE